MLFADTFNRYFERENLDAALRVLAAGGVRVHVAKPADGSARPLCCGRTFLSVGKVDEARREAERVVAALRAVVARGVTGRRAGAELPPHASATSIRRCSRATRRGGSPRNALLFEEFLAREAAAGRLTLPLAPIAIQALLHGHCHQKAFGAMGAVEATLKLVPDLAVETVESSCCGMAGGFGYHAETIDVSLAMGELSLLPAVRQAAAETHHRRRRHLVPPSDQGRYRTRGAARRARAGDEPGCGTPGAEACFPALIQRTRLASD